MAQVRHKHALQRTILQRVLRMALPAAAVLLLVAGSLVVAFRDATPVDSAVPASAHANVSDLVSLTSRSGARIPIVPDTPPPPTAAPLVVKASKYAVVALDIRTEPRQDAKVVGEAKAGSKVGVTGKTKDVYSEIVFKGDSRWVKTRWLSDDKPLGGAPCASGSAMEAGLQPDTIRVHRAICAMFPQITRYLGRGGGGEHASGRAVDIMTTDRATGDAIAAYCQQHWRELGVSQVIWRQRIWTVQRSGDGWRSMSNRGSATANHMNHVHVTTYGNQGTAAR